MPPNWAATPPGNPEAARRPHTPAADAQAPRSRERGPGLRPGPSPRRAAPASSPNAPSLHPPDREPRGGSARAAAPPPHPQGRPWPCPRPGPKGSSSRCSAEGSAGGSGDHGPSRQAPRWRGRAAHSPGGPRQVFAPPGPGTPPPLPGDSARSCRRCRPRAPGARALRRAAASARSRTER